MAHENDGTPSAAQLAERVRVLGVRSVTGADARLRGDRPGSPYVELAARSAELGNSPALVKTRPSSGIDLDMG